MSTYTLGLPAELRRRLERALPRQHGAHSPTIRVTPRDHRERKCAAYEADHYEVQAYYTTTSAASLDRLEGALSAVPGVYATTQVRADGPRTITFTNPAWPPALGTARHDRSSLRAQVIALISDAGRPQSERRESAGTCPRWCDGVHDPGFPLGRLHGRTVAEHGGAAVSVAHLERNDPHRDDGTVVFIDARASADPVRLEVAQAACLLQALETAGDGTSWLAGALRAALALLEPTTA